MSHWQIEILLFLLFREKLSEDEGKMCQLSEISARSHTGCGGSLVQIALVHSDGAAVSALIGRITFARNCSLACPTPVLGWMRGCCQRRAVVRDFVAQLEWGVRLEVPSSATTTTVHFWPGKTASDVVVVPGWSRPCSLSRQLWLNVSFLQHFALGTSPPNFALTAVVVCLYFLAWILFLSLTLSALSP